MSRLEKSTRNNRWSIQVDNKGNTSQFKNGKGKKREKLENISTSIDLQRPGMLIAGKAIRLRRAADGAVRVITT